MIKTMNKGMRFLIKSAIQKNYFPNLNNKDNYFTYSESVSGLKEFKIK